MTKTQTHPTQLRCQTRVKKPVLNVHSHTQLEQLSLPALGSEFRVCENRPQKGLVYPWHSSEAALVMLTGTQALREVGMAGASQAFSVSPSSVAAMLRFVSGFLYTSF